MAPLPAAAPFRDGAELLTEIHLPSPPLLESIDTETSTPFPAAPEIEQTTPPPEAA